MKCVSAHHRMWFSAFAVLGQPELTSLQEIRSLENVRVLHIYLYIANAKINSRIKFMVWTSNQKRCVRAVFFSFSMWMVLMNRTYVIQCYYNEFGSSTACCRVLLWSIFAFSTTLGWPQYLLCSSNVNLCPIKTLKGAKKCHPRSHSHSTVFLRLPTKLRFKFKFNVFPALCTNLIHSVLKH